ncbi:MAG: acyl carrier protein [Thermoleophilia bacterium]
MSIVEETDVRGYLCGRFAEQLAALGIAPGEEPDDLDLIAEGVTDSFGLLELIGDLEARFGIELDFEDLDPEDLTRLGPFSRYVASRARG